MSSIHKKEDRRIWNIIEEDLKKQGFKRNFFTGNYKLNSDAFIEAQARGGFTIGQLVHLNFARHQTALTFNDITGSPYKALASRKEADISTKLHENLTLPLPIISSNMECVTGYELAVVLAKMGGLAITHQFDEDPKCQADVIKDVKNTNTDPISIDDMIYTPALDKEGRLLVGGAIGTRNGSIDRAKYLVDAGVDVLVVDIAHGHSENMADVVSTLKTIYPDIPVAAGNVVTPKGADYLLQAGADILKVGVGPGAACTTRKVTGYGVPQVTAVYYCSLIAKHYRKTIWADGGLKSSGDMVKALATGANGVMVGSMLAPTDLANLFGQRIAETDAEGNPALVKYWGSASEEGKQRQNRCRYDAPEGVTTLLPYAGKTKTLLAQLDMGLRSGVSYAGCNGGNDCQGATIEKLQKHALFIKQHESGAFEGLKHR